MSAAAKVLEEHADAVAWARRSVERASRGAHYVTRTERALAALADAVEEGT